MRPSAWTATGWLFIASAYAACAPEGGGPEAVAEPAPDSFAVAFETSQGTVEVDFFRAWSPQAVDRLHQLVQMEFWSGARFYRVNERYAQFGYSGRPGLDSVWVPAGLPDEPVRESNVRGTVSFARAGPGTRSTILFVNRTDNQDLDAIAWNGVVGFPPVGRVRSGMDAIDGLQARYGDEAMRWEDSIAGLGNAFLDTRFPGLDSILSVRLVVQSP